MAQRESSSLRRLRRVRYNIKKKANGKPRLSVHRTGKHIYAQVIDDLNHKTLISSSSMHGDLKAKIKNGGNINAAKTVGESIGKLAVAKGITTVVFDRGSFYFHGRVRALADAARSAGLKF